MSIKSFFRNHQESILVALAFIFLGFLTAVVMWGMVNLTSSLGESITVKGTDGPPPSFNFDAIKKLNLKTLQKSGSQ